MKTNIIQSSSTVQSAMAATMVLRNSAIIGLPFNCDFCSQLARAVAALTGLGSIFVEVVSERPFTGAGGASETALL